MGVFANKPTVVTTELIAVDCKVLAEMSDGSLVTLSSPWGVPADSELRQWRWLTKEQLVERARSWNETRRHNCNYALHMDKVRRLGHDYASRGY